MQTRLKQRLLTAAVLLPLFFLALFFLNNLGFALFLTVILVFSLFEWANLSGLRSTPVRLTYIAAGVVCAAAIQFYALGGKELFIAIFLLWLPVIFRLVNFSRQGHDHDREKAAGNGQLAWIDGYFVLLPTMLGLQVLKTQDPAAPQLLLIFFFIIWAADTGAYLVGRTWGKHKLAPAISPGKTIEGLFGGLLGALTVAVVTGIFILHLPVSMLLLWLPAIMLVTLFSVVGDLFESVYKRRAGVKDSGTLLPGHGGVLDRIDSVCAALPPYMLVLYQFDLLTTGTSVP